MKKIVFVFALGSFFLASGCSGSGAYSEKEKKTQDSTDEVRQEEGFEALQNAAPSDSLSAADDSSANSQ